jgi:type III restriction enzyme
MAIRFPVVEGYAFALRKNLIRCDVDGMEALILEPNREPTATFLMPTVGYKEGYPSQQTAQFEFVEQTREAYYEQTHIQAIKFQIARLVLDELLGGQSNGSDAKGRVLRLQSRHQLFPQIYRFVDEYTTRKVDLQGCHPCELGLQKYVRRMVERLRDQIMPDDTEGEAPLMPVLNRYKPIGTTAEVNFKTVRPCFMTQRSHINQVVADTATWETGAAFRIEQAEMIYARNDHLGLFVPYEYQGVDHNYEPDFLVRLAPGVTLILEIKGYEDDEIKAKHNAAKRWVSAVNNWGQLGKWMFHVCHNPQVLDKELAYLARQWARAA